MIESRLYFVTISGNLWGGELGELELKFETLPTAADVKDRAGDFQSYEIENSFVKFWRYEHFDISQ